MEAKGLRETTMTNLLWKFMERIFAQGVSTVVAVILARILMPSDYGVVTLVLVFINICNTFVSEGFASALIQKKDADQVDFSSMFYVSTAVSIGIYIVLFLLAPFISGFFGDGYELLTPILRVLCLRIPIASINAIQQAYVSRHLMFKKFFWSTSIGTFISAFVGIGAALLGMGSWALVAQYLTNVVIDTCVLWFTVKWRPGRYFSLKRVKEMFSFGGKLLIAGLIDTVYDEMRSIIIGYKYSSANLAYYNKGRHFPQLIVHNINSSLMAVLYPVMSKFQSNRAQLREIAVKSIKLSTYVIFPCMLGFAAVAEPFVSFLLTDKWLPCVPYIRIFCITYSFYPIYTASLQGIKALGRSDAYMVTQIAKKTVDIIILIITIPFGIYWIALGMLFSKFIVYIINGISAKKVLGYKFHRQVLDILPNVILTAIMYLVVMAVPSPHSKAAELFIKCLVGGIVYIVLSIVTRNENFFILWDMLKKRTIKTLGFNLKHILGDIIRIRSAMRRCSDYLCAGKYKMNDTKTIVYREDIRQIVPFESTFLYRAVLLQKRTKWIDKLLGRFYVMRIRGGRKEFGGQLLMFTSSNEEIKIFDYSSHKIMTLYNHQEKADRILKNHRYWGQYFPVSALKAEPNGPCLTESFIEKKCYDSEHAFLSVFHSYIHYVKVQSENSCFSQGSYDTPQLKRFLCQIDRSKDYEKILSILNTAPFCITHGDLWTSNIIFDGNSYFHIDFEDMGPRVFFFDILTYIFSDYLLNRNESLLNKYLCGEYDDLMAQLFLAAKYPYSKTSRLEYLECMCFLTFTERWDNESSKKVVEAIRRLSRRAEATQWLKLRSALEHLFESFNENGVSYCILRDCESIQMINGADDIDLSISEEHQDIACKILNSEGWITPVINANTFAHTQYYKWDTDKMMKLDILWGIYFDDGKYRLKNESAVYDHFSLLKNSAAHIPSRKEGLELLMLHLLLDKREVSAKNMVQLKHLYDKKEGWAACAAAQIIEQGKEELPQINPDLSDIPIEKGIVSVCDNSSWKLTHENRLLEWNKRTRNFNVAVVGVDGTGKSTLINALHSYYGDNVHVTYMGFRSYSTLTAKLFAGKHKLRIPFKRLSSALYMLSTYHEMHTRLYKALQNTDKLILFDRYVWEANDNAGDSFSLHLSRFLFKKHFPRPDGIIYLYCPAETSLLRKDDILYKEKFIRMKQHTDEIYKSMLDVFTIDTYINPPEEVKRMAVEYICELSQGRFR